MEHWISYLYLYGVGGFLFSIPVYLGIKKGVLKLNRTQDRLILIGLIGGLLFYAILQGLWNWYAISSQITS
ncbi:MAG: hypothetical protein CL678_12320 [Bdellovibrionaceae bacterium]|nr:hypothetical protein [Pseudobdellovibrionaceae bacterium]|tara:strand:- start:2202 stop:2414 length:213 start_codon:yes stop_codon:yes gene_type:complete